MKQTTPSLEMRVKDKILRIYQLEEIKESLKKYFSSKPVHKVFLFGSYAREEANENSDIDLLLDLNYEPGISMVFAFMKDELESLLKKNIDIITTIPYLNTSSKT